MTAQPKALAVPGQIETDSGHLIPIVIADLSETICVLGKAVEAGTASKLWLGAIGPLHIRPRKGMSDRFDFDGAIHPAIVAHFRGARAG